MTDNFLHYPVSRRQLLLKAFNGGTVLVMGSFLAACGIKEANPSPSSATTSGAGSTSAAKGGSAAQTATVKWVSPRGNIEVVDDFHHSVAMKMGYLKELGIEAVFEPGPMEATATTKLVATRQGDVGFPSPGVFSLAIQAGVPIVSVWNMDPRDCFSFSMKPDSPIKKVTDLAGKRIALGDPGWQAIADPLLKIGGVDPKTVEYVAAGAQWGQAVAEGKADAALSWLGLIAQWEGSGLVLRHIYAIDWSPFPSNTYVVHKEDLTDPKKADVLKRFLKAISMGMTWGYENPRGAVQLSYERFPALKSQMTPEVGVKSLLQLHKIFTSPETEKNGWGWHRMDGWSAYFKTLRELGQVSKDIKTEEVLTNDWIAAVNSFDKERVKQDARNFKLASEFEAVDIRKIKVLG